MRKVAQGLQVPQDWQAHREARVQPELLELPVQQGLQGLMACKDLPDLQGRKDQVVWMVLVLPDRVVLPAPAVNREQPAQVADHRDPQGLQVLTEPTEQMEIRAQPAKRVQTVCKAQPDPLAPQEITEELEQQDPVVAPQGLPEMMARLVPQETMVLQVLQVQPVRRE